MRTFELKEANILIVDDQQDNIDILTGLLEYRGYSNLKTTTDPRTVVDLYNSFEPDLILLDLMMPHIDGFRVMSQLNEIIPENCYLPILVLTADVSLEAKQRALNSGAKDFITKPFDLIEVELRIKNLLETRVLHLQLKDQNKYLEEEVRKRTIELEKANHDLLQLDNAKSDFLSLISHEINTPLNGILGFIGILKNELKTTKFIKMLEYLEISSKRLERFSRVSLNITRLKTNELSVQKDNIPGVYFIESIKEKHEDEMKVRGINLVYDEQQNNNSIYCDTSLADFCFDSVLKNAIQYSPKGEDIIVNINEAPNNTTVTFTDCGPGFSENALEKLFNPFSPGEEHIDKNKGLDLVLVKLIMDAHNGKIDVYNNEPKGSVVSLTFPGIGKEVAV
ncbi:ATP-binding response regulator [Maribellus maritimus]|uniref:ATP-binding response regulator n=1 Tax=Maribellus maritimus TaxID=2870838 RepID=UPI001EEAB546|nr:response regulator [Maribellus maritimus]MCG6189353.1 response regulator [Maribellus maritimus]